VTPAQRSILLRTLGVHDDAPGRPAKNFYHAAPGDDGYGDLQVLVDLGYMRRGETVRAGEVRSAYYEATVEGVQVVVGLVVSRAEVEGWLGDGKWTRRKAKARP
jgi:hypothetical protein